MLAVLLVNFTPLVLLPVPFVLETASSAQQIPLALFVVKDSW